MKNDRYYSVNKMPVYCNALLLILMFSGCFFIKKSLDTDFYFLYSFGEYIVNNGFPVKDVLSMHGDMNIIVQQWLVDLLFYHAYELHGQQAVLAIVYVVYAAYVILLYKLCKHITGNFFLSVMVTLSSSCLMASVFMVTRPQIFTYLIFILLLYALEQYVSTRKIRWLFLLPLLSWVQINIHASMWLMLFVLMMPYVISSVSIKLPFYTQEARCKLVDLLVAVVAMIAVALLNPYGYKALVYLFGSFGVENLNKTIQEMAAVTISHTFGKLYMGILFLMGALLVACRKRKMELRFLCLTLGTAVLGLTSYKATAYFFVVGLASYAHYFRDFDFTLKGIDTSTRKEKVQLAVQILVLALTIGGILMVYTGKQTKTVEFGIVGLEPVADYLDAQESEDMVLYAGFNEGAYLEFRGYKPYLDASAELFMEEKNGQFDYFSEYLYVVGGKSYYKDFLNKYGFTHIVVPTGENYLYISIFHDPDYEIGYTDEVYTVFTSEAS